jgi:hypothetical protein
MYMRVDMSVNMGLGTFRMYYVCTVLYQWNVYIRKARNIHTYYEVVHRCTGTHQSASVREDVDSYIGRRVNEAVLILRHEYADGRDFVHGAEE